MGRISPLESQLSREEGSIKYDTPTTKHEKIFILIHVNFVLEDGLIHSPTLFIYALVVAIMTALFFCQIEAQLSSISIQHLHAMMHVIEPIVLGVQRPLFL